MPSKKSRTKIRRMKRFIFFLTFVFVPLYCRAQFESHFTLTNNPPYESPISFDISVKQYEPHYFPSHYYHQQMHHPACMTQYPEWCAQWSQADYAQAVMFLYGTAVPRTFNSSDCVFFPYTETEDLAVHTMCLENVMQQWKLYEYDNFRNFIKAIPGYEERLYKILTQVGADECVKSCIPQHIQKTLALEYTRIQGKKEIQRQIDEHTHLQAEEAKTFVVHKDFAKEMYEYENLQAVYQDFTGNKNERMQNRIAALKQIAGGNNNRTTQLYDLSPHVFGSLYGTKNTDGYFFFTGNPFQHALHKECIDFIDHVAHVPQSSPFFDYCGSLIECADGAHEYNRIGEVKNALTILDFCWALVDCGSALVEGAGLGLVGAVKDIAEHPLQATACALAGEYVLAYQLGKVLVNVAQIGLHAMADAEQGKKEWDEYIAPLTHVIDAIEHKEIATRDALKGGAALATGIMAQNRILGGLGYLCSKVKTNALEWARKNPLAAPEQYVATSDGLVLRAVNEKIHDKIIYNEISKTTALTIEKTNYIFAAEEIEEGVRWAMDENKLEHIFNKSEHHLNQLIDKLGTQENVVREILYGLSGKVNSDGIFKNVIVSISGFNVHTRGRVMNGIPKIGTMFIKEL